LAGGRIIFLNGTSSSGKSTLARALQTRLPEPHMHVAIDAFFSMYPERIWNATRQEDQDAFLRLVPTVVSGVQRAAAALAEAGNHVILDHVLEDPAWLRECIERWDGLDVLFVGVRCPLPELERREALRSDRAPGLAAYQFDRVHAHGMYDVEVDTSVLGVDACVATIVAALARGGAPRAFSRLRRQAAHDVTEA
jgi:chloramphenicol 3-O phosphotransferase